MATKLDFKGYFKDLNRFYKDWWKEATVICVVGTLGALVPIVADRVQYELKCRKARREYIIQFEKKKASSENEES